ncbi:hypothetical protein LEP1GSC013_2782 [Leptospira interrogans serovar Valbuzzi str. Duyster]|nr:hypothetical protein LEP1GSC013_2782 [Leptospira interrogans serovar Valbuzzi str. Duyster]
MLSGWSEPICGSSHKLEYDGKSPFCGSSHKLEYDGKITDLW